MKKRNHKSLALYEQPQDYYYHNHIVSPSADANLPVDFTSDPEVVRLVVEGERLTYGHLFNPAFATEISMIEPLPHQRIAVYDHMLQQPRLRFLLADDAGAGKTIMTGLYIREMLTRRLISRVLIVPPAGLVGNWEHEMHSLFNLPFTIVAGSDARSSNPFTDPQSDLLIVSVDTLPGHVIPLVRNVIYIIENLFLEELARDQCYEFTFICLPLKLQGATGSPVRPVAVASGE